VEAWNLLLAGAVEVIALDQGVQWRFMQWLWIKQSTSPLIGEHSTPLSYGYPNFILIMMSKCITTKEITMQSSYTHHIQQIDFIHHVVMLVCGDSNRVILFADRYSQQHCYCTAKVKLQNMTKCLIVSL